MNALTTALRSLDSNAQRQPHYFASSNGQSHSQHRARDFGVGYGNSSGYAAQRRYVSDTTPRLFRLH